MTRLAILILLGVSPEIYLASGDPTHDQPASPFATVSPVSLNEVRWTGGFWADRFDACRNGMIPGLWAIMEGTNYSQFYENFRIAAGLSEGRHRGPTFNDGDFYKWLEAACAVLASSADPESDKRIEEIISVIAKAQRTDGYIHTPILIAERNAAASSLSPLTSHLSPLHDPLQFEMYNMGHLFTAACVHYRVTGRTNLIQVARKAADFLDEAFRHPTPELAKISVCPSHYMGLVDLYRTTREARYLELAKRLFAMRDLVSDGTDDNQDRIPFEEQTNCMGHAVRANYLYAGAADLFIETGDNTYWNPLELIWTNLVEQKMYITGGCGALYDGASPDGSKDQKSITRVHQAYGRNYQLPNLTAHNETCANIGNVLLNWRMFLATGQARFLDVLELALYNSVLSGASLDGTNFFYANPLRVLEPMPVNLRWQRKRLPYISTFCCPPNLARTIAESAGYAYSKSSNALWINLYGNSRISTTLPGGQRVSLKQETDYPWNGLVRITLEDCSGDPFSLKLRIPGWAAKPTIHLNDQLLSLSSTPSSYMELSRTWRIGDVVEMDLPMPAQIMEANPFVEEALNQVALKRGPLVYCLESTDLPRSASLEEAAIPANMNLTARYDRRVLGGVVLIEGLGIIRTARQWNGQLYRERTADSWKQVSLRFIPYYAWANRGPSEMTVWLPLSTPAH